jgi:lysophospholipase L1-like esterase
MRIAFSLVVIAGLAAFAPAQAPNLQRFEKTIAGFETTDKGHPPPKDPIVFTGSSSIARWKDLAKAFPEYPVLNRGFGGSTTPEVNHYFDRVVAAYKPRVIVFFCGGNDLADKRTPQQVIEDFGTFLKMAHEKLPGTKVVYISQHVPASRDRLKEAFFEVNRAVREAATSDPLLKFVDIHDKMLGKDGSANPDLYEADKLHPNAAAYRIWADELRPVLKAAYVAN